MGNNNIKNNYVEATVMNMYATIQLHPPYGFWEEDFLFYFIYLFILFFFFFRKFSILVAMATNQNQRYRQNSYGR